MTTKQISTMLALSVSRTVILAMGAATVKAVPNLATNINSILKLVAIILNLWDYYKVQFRKKIQEKQRKLTSSRWFRDSVMMNLHSKKKISLNLLDKYR